MPKRESRSRSAVFARAIESERKDHNRTHEALRLQTKAWRTVAMIATADPIKGAKLARWLLMHSYPWVHEGPVRMFITEHEAEAEESGLKSGVFDVQTASPK